VVPQLWVKPSVGHRWRSWRMGDGMTTCCLVSAITPLMGRWQSSIRDNSGGIIVSRGNQCLFIASCCSSVTIDWLIVPMGEITSLNCGYQLACSSTRWYMNIENHGGMVSTGENSRFVHQISLWQSYKQSYLVANQEELGEGNNGFCLRNISFILRRVIWRAVNTTCGRRLYFPPT
jgi:hypothetical protein